MLRKITPEDLDLAEEIEQLCFIEPWKKEFLLEEFEKGDFSHPYFYVDERDGKIKGYAIFWTLFEQADLVRFCILPEYRRQHLGEKFLLDLMEQAFFEEAEVMRLEVRENNLAAIALYKKLGFVETRRRENYYSNGDNSIEMARGF